MPEWPDIPELWQLLSRYEERWAFLYPDIDLTKEVLRMAEWCEANPGKRPKKNWKRFMTLWLGRSQSRMEVAEVIERVKREDMRLAAHHQYVDLQAVLEQIQARKPRFRA